jgi:GntR family transcriptional repressor for pyruvate dehydrogenase complex
MEDCEPGDRVTEYRLDQEFHQMIADATRNPVVPLMMQPVYALIPRIRDLVHAHAPDARGKEIEEYRRILQAIRQRDEDAAYHEMQFHISNAAQQANAVVDALDAATAAQVSGVPDTRSTM